MRASDQVDIAALNEGFAKFEVRCRDALGSDAKIDRFIGMLFRQQVHEVFVEVPNKLFEADDVDALVDRFQEKYERLYGKGSALWGSGVEFTTLRTEVILPVLKPRPIPLEPARGKPQPIAMRRVYFYRAGFEEAAVYRSNDLGAGHVIAGPAIVERPDTTVVVGIGQRLEIERYGNMIICLAVTGAH